MIARTLIYNEWTGRPDWSKMRASGSKEYSESDIDNFVEIVFRQVAEKLAVKYEDVKDILYGRNIDFFETKARIFHDYDDLSGDDRDLIELKALLEIPEIETCEKFSATKVFFESFKELDIKEQVEILDRLNRIKIKFPHIQNGFDPNSFFKYFENLSRQDKYDVLKEVLAAEVSEKLE